MKKTLLSFLMLTCMLLSSCRINVNSLIPENQNSTEKKEQETQSDTGLAMVSPAQPNQTFGVGYVNEGVLDPYETDYQLNRALSHLLYDSLFTISENGLPINGLCRNISTEDRIIYILEIREGVCFHDGSALTADDVAYSLNRARFSSLYREQLSVIADAVATSDSVLKITLTRALGSLTLLLDVPVTARHPSDDYLYHEYALLGSGRYSIDLETMEESEYTYLQYNSDWYDAPSEKPAVTRIDLFTVSDKEDLVRRCYNSDIDIISLESDEEDRIIIHGDTEKRELTGRNLYYVGFNMNLQSFSDARSRRAIGQLLDRDALTEILGSEGFKGVTLPFRSENRAAGYQKKTGDTSAEEEPLTEVKALLNESGFSGSCAYYMSQPYVLNLLACSESEVTCQIADYVKNRLEEIGFTVETNYCDSTAYAACLYNSTYTLYIGVTQPTENYDFTYLSQPSALFQRLYTQKTGNAAEEIPMGNSEELQAALQAVRNLNSFDSLYSLELSEKIDALFTEQMPIVPLCYNMETVYLRGSFASGVRLTSWDCFYNIQNWAQPR